MNFLLDTHILLWFLRVRVITKTRNSVTRFKAISLVKNASQLSSIAIAIRSASSKLKLYRDRNSAACWAMSELIAICTLSQIYKNELGEFVPFNISLR